MRTLILMGCGIVAAGLSGCALDAGRRPASAADDSTFDFTAQQFVTLYNGRTAKCDDKTVFNDQGCVDKVKSIRVVADEATLSMDDSNFQVAVRELKRLGLVEGKIAFDAKLRLGLAKNGLVKSISITGSPRDLANWSSTLGMVALVYELLNPGFTEESEHQFLNPLVDLVTPAFTAESKQHFLAPLYELVNPESTAKSEQQFLAPLGHPAIGHPMTNVSPGGAFACNARRSSGSLEFGCVIVPHRPPR